MSIQETFEDFFEANWPNYAAMLRLCREGKPTFDPINPFEPMRTYNVAKFVWKYKEKERVRQIEVQAMKKLRKVME